MADDKAVTVEGDTGWVDEIEISGRGTFTSVARELMEKRAAKSGKVFYSSTSPGQLKKSRRQIINLMNDAGFRLTQVHNQMFQETPSMSFLGEDYNIHVETYECRVSACDLSIFNKAMDVVLSFFGPFKEIKGKVYMLVQNHNGLAFEPVGIAGSKLVRENYTEKTLEAYDHFIEELAEEDPCGRLFVMSGIQGSGKTRVIRAMIGTDAANFAFIPPSLVPSISGPGIIKAVKDFSRSEPGKAMVFILEDADECLLPRAVDNMSSISSILNASEGILGTLMNIRIVATTNANIRQLDKAITRPGRLCGRADVGTLVPEHATRVLRRLVEGADAIHEETTLAEVYNLARKLGWSDNGKKHSKPLDNHQEPATLGYKLESKRSV